ncbi:MAG: M28 family peptidase [Nitrospirota bacterium]|nr:M28 family peptidase [Nitrospirota bacterium]
MGMQFSFGLTALSCLWVFLSPTYAGAQPEGDLVEALKSVDPVRLVQDVKVLSSPDFAGRQAGTEGGQRSAAFIAERFGVFGLTPAGTIALDSQNELWTQTGPIPVAQIDDAVTVEFSSGLGDGQRPVLHPAVGSDYLPVLDSPSINVVAPVVFVGYGISDPARDFDEYQGLDVRNRVVMFLRGKPRNYPRWVTHVEKERIARENGAVGFLTLTGPTLSAYAARRGMGHAPLAFYNNLQNSRPLPGCWVSTAVGEKVFASQGLSLQELQKNIDEHLTIQSRELGILARLRWESHQEVGRLINVLGVIPGSDPKLREETVVIGAHRDHFGQQAGLLFPGADDNASGTAVLLEVARILKESSHPPRRTILFASFSGEEQDLQGSRLYVKSPARTLSQTVAMINVDHVGIGNGKLTVGVTKIPKEVAKEAAQMAGLSGDVELYGFFPGGDHVPFAKAGIPTVAVVTSGAHPFFHQPSDVPETIQPHVLEAAARYVLALTWILANPTY